MPAPDLRRIESRARAALDLATAEQFLAYLRKDPPPPPDALHARVTDALSLVRQAKETHPALDLPTAERIATTCHALVDATAEGPPEHRSLTAAAVAYFADPVDHEPDWDSTLGFADDARILDWVIEELGLDLAARDA